MIAKFLKSASQITNRITARIAPEERSPLVRFGTRGCTIATHTDNLDLFSSAAEIGRFPMEAAMGSFKKSHSFDPLDLEIIDLVYRVAWEQVSSREPSRDTAQDEERQAQLRKQCFAFAGNSKVDFDILLDRVLASLPEPLRQVPTDRDYV